MSPWRSIFQRAYPAPPPLPSAAPIASKWARHAASLLLAQDPAWVRGHSHRVEQFLQHIIQEAIQESRQ